MEDSKEGPNHTCIDVECLFLLQSGPYLPHLWPQRRLCPPDIWACDEDGLGFGQPHLFPDYTDCPAQFIAVRLPCADHNSLRCKGGYLWLPDLRFAEPSDQLGLHSEEQLESTNPSIVFPGSGLKPLPMFHQSLLHLWSLLQLSLLYPPTCLLSSLLSQTSSSLCCRVSNFNLRLFLALGFLDTFLIKQL